MRLELADVTEIVPNKEPERSLFLTLFDPLEKSEIGL